MELQWPLILFTFFTCLSCGFLFMQGLLTYLGRAKEMQFKSLVASAVALAVGGIAVFMHLQHWERMFNGFGHITSGITQELIGVVFMGVAIVMFFLFMRRSEDGQAPKWVAIVAMVVSVGMVFVMAHSYLMPAIPAWNTAMLIVFYLVNMVSMGALASLVLAAVVKQEDAYSLLAQIAFWAALCMTVVYIAYAFLIQGATFAEPGYYFDPTLPDVAVTVPGIEVARIMSGDLALPFWGGTVACGGVVAALCAYFAWKKPEKLGILPVACVGLLASVIGGLCWRCILYVAAFSIFAIF